jgi:hypothetical protein
MHRYLFIGGLHRSGTSLLARLLAAHPEVSAIREAPVPENEGCYLQGAIPHTALDGAPMRFATDPRQHLVEGCAYDTLATRQRMEADWAPWFDPEKPWRVEKSPVNLTRMRLYQQLFPLSQCVVILRHPEAVAQAVAKWLPDPADALVAHWIAAHEQTAEDLRYLHAVCVIRYEDLCQRPAAVIAGLHRFMGLPPGPPPDALRDGNADYPAAPQAATAAAARWGYAPGQRVLPWQPLVQHPLRALREEAFAMLQPDAAAP